jgi:biopolymer transport protein TolR
MQTGGAGESGGSGGGTGAGSYRTLRSRRETPSIGEINVTPLVDVVLVLLIIFMVTAPMMSRGIDVTLPVATQTENPPEDRLTISVNAEGRVYLSDRPVNLVLLEQTLRDYLAAGRAGRVVILRADESLRYGKVIEVVDKIKRAGVEQIGFAYVLPDEKKTK